MENGLRRDVAMGLRGIRCREGRGERSKISHRLVRQSLESTRDLILAEPLEMVYRGDSG